MTNEIAIKRLEEKSAIVFYELMRNQKRALLPTDLSKFISKWRGEWSKDFLQFKNQDNSWNNEQITAYFEPVFNESYSKWGELDSAKMKLIRLNFSKVEMLPNEIRNIAAKKGLKVIKSHSEKDRMKLGGFCIFRERKNVKNMKIKEKSKLKFDRVFEPISGIQYELTYGDVCHFFDISKEQAEKYISDYKDNLDNGYIPSKKAVQEMSCEKTYSEAIKAKMSAQDKIFEVFDIQRVGHRVNYLKSRQMYLCIKIFRKLFPEEYYKIQKQDDRIDSNNKLTRWIQEQYVIYKKKKDAEITNIMQASISKN